MSQTITSLAALGCIVVYSVGSQRSSHERVLQNIRTQVEAHAVEIGADLLDLAGTLPFDGSAAGSAVSFDAADTLDQWDGLSEVVEVATADDTLRYTVRAVVEPVERSGSGFAVASPSAPFRRVTLAVAGDLSVAASTQRVYADLSQ